jgi:hypothetical protein
VGVRTAWPMSLNLRSPSRDHRSGCPTFGGTKIDTIDRIIFALLIDHIAIRFGRIASKYGKNPSLEKILPFVSPVSLVIHKR